MVSFLNAFMSYLVVVLVIVVVAGIAVTIGIWGAKQKNKSWKKKQAVTENAKENPANEKA